MEISGWVAHWASWTPDKTALRFEGRTISYAELELGVGSLAAWLRGSGVLPGDRVAYLGQDLGPIGTSIQNPDIEYHKLAESMGWWAKGPIKDPAELGPAIKEAVAAVRSGQPALLNVWTQPR